MAKKEVNMQFDDSEFTPAISKADVAKAIAERDRKTEEKEHKSEVQVYNPTEELESCLRNEKVIVKFVPKETDNITDKRHIAYGGMMDNALRSYSLPILSSGTYKNPLTKAEKNYLEYIMGLEPNALSVHKKNDNYWDGITVTLTKQDNILDLTDPTDYIKYKVLLANSTYIADSLRTLNERPEATFEYVIIEKGEENAVLKDNVSNTLKCYEEFSKIKDNFDIMKCIIETIDGRNIASNTKIEFLQSKINEIIVKHPKVFLESATDKSLPAKVLITKAVDKGLVLRRGDFYYLAEDGLPLCDNNQDPTITVAAKYLSLPKNQELKFSLEAKLK